jgi:hypothetical protein
MSFGVQSSSNHESKVEQRFVVDSGFRAIIEEPNQPACCYDLKNYLLIELSKENLGFASLPKLVYKSE